MPLAELWWHRRRIAAWINRRGRLLRSFLRLFTHWDRNKVISILTIILLVVAFLSSPKQNFNQWPLSLIPSMQKQWFNHSEALFFPFNESAKFNGNAYNLTGYVEIWGKGGLSAGNPQMQMDMDVYIPQALIQSSNLTHGYFVPEGGYTPPIKSSNPESHAFLDPANIQLSNQTGVNAKLKNDLAGSAYVEYSASGNFSGILSLYNSTSEITQVSIPPIIQVAGIEETTSTYTNSVVISLTFVIAAFSILLLRSDKKR